MRWLWHGLWMFSLLIALGLLSLWIACPWWSFHFYDMGWSRQWLRSAVFVEDGFVMGCLWHPYQQASLIDPGSLQGFERVEDGYWWKDPDLAASPTFRFAWITLDLTPRQGPNIGLDWLYMPLLYPLLLFLILPTIQMARGISYLRRNMQGRCVYCGYDLRGSTDSCPECGRKTTNKTTPQPA